eukprot:TRINITY_DN6768_c0_g3_i1.p1 TRINITY_DN6768_c0_g3~~TRINITY_DN6768_c0_g3_i1.p1  ORF type:complete len:486 (-),score=73.30 TRINITY_DN6768_c0_g3_i1:98-1555(-)
MPSSDVEGGKEEIGAQASESNLIPPAVAFMDRDVAEDREGADGVAAHTSVAVSRTDGAPSPEGKKKKGVKILPWRRNEDHEDEAEEPEEAELRAKWNIPPPLSAQDRRKVRKSIQHQVQQVHYQTQFGLPVRKMSNNSGGSSDGGVSTPPWVNSATSGHVGEGGGRVTGPDVAGLQERRGLVDGRANGGEGVRKIFSHGNEGEGDVSEEGRRTAGMEGERGAEDGCRETNLAVEDGLFGGRGGNEGEERAKWPSHAGGPTTSLLDDTRGKLPGNLDPDGGHDDGMPASGAKTEERSGRNNNKVHDDDDRGSSSDAQKGGSTTAPNTSRDCAGHSIEVEKKKHHHPSAANSKSLEIDHGRVPNRKANTSKDSWKGGAKNSTGQTRRKSSVNSDFRPSKGAMLACCAGATCLNGLIWYIEPLRNALCCCWDSPNNFHWCCCSWDYGAVFDCCGVCGDGCDCCGGTCTLEDCVLGGVGGGGCDCTSCC